MDYRQALNPTAKLAAEFHNRPAIGATEPEKPAKINNLKPNIVHEAFQNGISRELEGQLFRLFVLSGLPFGQQKNELKEGTYFLRNDGALGDVACRMSFSGVALPNC